MFPMGSVTGRGSFGSPGSSICKADSLEPLPLGTAQGPCASAGLREAWSAGAPRSAPDVGWVLARGCLVRSTSPPRPWFSGARPVLDEGRWYWAGRGAAGSGGVGADPGGPPRPSTETTPRGAGRSGQRLPGAPRRPSCQLVVTQLGPARVPDGLPSPFAPPPCPPGRVCRPCSLCRAGQATDWALGRPGACGREQRLWGQSPGTQGGGSQLALPESGGHSTA